VIERVIDWLIISVIRLSAAPRFVTSLKGQWLSCARRLKPLHDEEKKRLYHLLSGKIDAFLRRAHRYGLAANISTVSELFDSVAQDFFNKIQSPDHCLHSVFIWGERLFKCFLSTIVFLSLSSSHLCFMRLRLFYAIKIYLHPRINYDVEFSGRMRVQLCRIMIIRSSYTGLGFCLWYAYCRRIKCKIPGQYNWLQIAKCGTPN